MSHATVIVITRGNQTVDELMAPYDENEEVTPYEDDCYCIGPQSKAADPKCDECKGTGKRMSQYNPKSKWDWFTFGGRFMGVFAVKPGATMVVGRPGVFDNECPPNRGDVARFADIDWDAMREDRIKDAFKWWHKARMPKAFVWDKSILEQTLKEAQDEAANSFTPYAILTPDGVWHQRAELGWFGASSNEQPKEKWAAECAEIFSSCEPDDILSSVDFHI